jgi:CBS domain-containing protein
MRVDEWMDRGHAGIAPEATVRDALVDLLRYDRNGVAVVDRRGALLGILTLSDIRRRLLPSPEELTRDPDLVHDPEFMEERFRELSSATVDALMTRGVATVGPRQSLLQAAAVLSARGVKQLPVVERGHLRGMISQRDVAWAFLTRSRGAA